MKATIIYGSDTGATEYVIENYLKDILEIYFELDCIEVNSIEPNIWNTEDLIIIGLSTWYDGILQSDWDDYFDEFKEINSSQWNNIFDNYQNFVNFNLIFNMQH